MLGNCKNYLKEQQMPESMRSFLSFDIKSITVRKRLASIQQLLIQTGADLRLVDPLNIHITIRFLGYIKPSTVKDIFQEMKKVNFTSFQAEIKGLGVFPNLNYPRIVWAGINEGADEVKAVFNQLEPRLRRLGFTPDRKGFNPHLTIARVKSGRNKERLADFITQNKDYPFGRTEIDCLRLKRSTLTPKGPIYSTLEEFCPELKLKEENMKNAEKSN